jgi:hypothetical protein
MRWAVRWTSSHWSALGLVLADLATHALGEDLGAAAGQAAEAGVDELAQDLLVRHAELLGEVVDLDGGVGLDVDVGAQLLEHAQAVLVVVEGRPPCRPLTMWISVTGWSRRSTSFWRTWSIAHRVRGGDSGVSRANEQNLQSASQTLVGLMWKLTLKKVRSPCRRSRTSLARAPTASRSG